ncbi:2-aminoethanethiol dioxygenase [Bacillus rossius redtenbacheri]|uniref:2-aminoethanethiol dioxygenase n=1 Tax=Bacillus rossius redtenbacheri TaxID=93214 RepID=UPI002FDD5026
MGSEEPSMQKLWKQALLTFSNNCSGNARGQNFHENFLKLKTLADQITAEHVNLDARLVNPSAEGRPRFPSRRPPVTYIEVYEDADVTIGIFVLKAGARLPLHDHPRMHGVLKVLLGTVAVQSYSPRRERSTQTGEVVAVKHAEVSADATSGACVLTPVDRNLHEIRSVGGPAAFLDILSPPYDPDGAEPGGRQCHYYEEAPRQGDEEGAESVRLRRVPSPPPDFWNDSAPYGGPALQS